MHLSKDGRAEGSQRSGTVLLLKRNAKDQNEIPRPKKKRISRLLRSTSKCFGNQEVRMTVPSASGWDGFFRSQT